VLTVTVVVGRDEDKEQWLLSRLDFNQESKMMKV
jgi:hypothetical protein